MYKSENSSSKMEDRKSINDVRISGIFEDNFTYHHESNGQLFYKTMVMVTRKSGVIDKIPVVIPEFLLPDEPVKEKYAKIEGIYKSYNRRDPESNKTHLELYVYAKNIMIFKYDYPLYDENFIHLTGYLCKPPIYRLTHKGTKICELMLATHNMNKSYYIPCIAWDINAEYARGLSIGDEVQLLGRIQLREYLKKIDDERCEKREAYEVSIMHEFGKVSHN